MDVVIPPFPRISRRARLRFDQVRDSHVLLLPERVVVLGESSAEILTLCDGSHTVEQILATLKTRYPDADLEADVLEFLQEAVQRKWLERPVDT